VKERKKSGRKGGKREVWSEYMDNGAGDLSRSKQIYKGKEDRQNIRKMREPWPKGPFQPFFHKLISI
jgi:hypothetical protein